MNLKTPWIARVVGFVVLVFTNALCAGSARSQTPAPTPIPTAAAAGQSRPSPTPAQRREAPPGVYYLIEDTVVPLKNGIRGVLAGTEVRLVRDNGDGLQVTEDGSEFTVKKTQVTNDLDIAAAIQKRTASIVSLNEKSLQEQEAILIKLQQDEIEFLRTHPLASPTPTPTPQGRK